MKKSSSDWIQIAKQVSNHPFIKIPCPDCEDDFLQIHIVPWKGKENKLDIHLICETCNSRNTITREAEAVYPQVLSGNLEE